MQEIYRLILSPEAAGDLEMIYAFVAQDSPNGAAKMIDRLLMAMDSLKTFPHRTMIAQQHGRLKYPVRSLPVTPHVIFSRVLEDTKSIRILTVRHGARRRPKRFD